MQVSGSDMVSLMCQEEGATPSSSWNPELKKWGRNSHSAKIYFQGGSSPSLFFLMFFHKTSSTAVPLPPLPIVFPSVISSAPEAEQLSCNDGICWYHVSGSKKMQIFRRKKRTLSEMDKAPLMIQGISQGRESVNLIYGLNVLSWAGLPERGAWPSASPTPVWVSRRDGTFAWSNRASKPNPAQSLTTVSE